MKDRLIELLRNAPKTDVVYGDIKLSEPVQTLRTIADHLIANGVIVLPFLRKWYSDSIWCGYELLYDDNGTLTIIHFGKSQIDQAEQAYKEIAEKALAERGTE